MVNSNAWARTAALSILLIGAAPAHPAEAGDRSGTVVAARVELQRQIGEWLTRSLAGVAAPHRVEVAVALELRGSVRELRSKQESVTPSVKIGSKSRVKLPGLGMVEGGSQGTVMPDIDIGGGARVSESVSRQVETEVARLTVMLFVDPAMPKERREMLARLASDLARIDRARGDEVVTREWLEAAGDDAGAAVVRATIQPKVPYEVLALCATGLLGATIISFGLRRGGRGGATLLRGGDRQGTAEAGPAPAADRVAGSRHADGAREELGAFKELAGATPKELVQVLAEADPSTAATIADVVGLDAEAAKLVETLLPPERRIEIGLGLATSRVLTREQLAQLEEGAARALRRVRDRIPLGGPARLADFLALAPAEVRREVLDGVAAREPELAQATRQAMVLFEDLVRLSDAAIRQVVTGLDPGTVALALIGAPESRDRVHGAVSKRLRGILETEEEAVKNAPPPKVEAARLTIEDAMRQLTDRGEPHASTPA
jgi:flagellar motor switch protein FliG